VAALGAALGRGVALVIDYGVGPRYYHPARAGTALPPAPRARDPFLHPGCRTLPPGWISRLAEAAVDAGSGRRLPRPRSCWRAASRRTWHRVDGATARAVAAGAQLLLPGEMGETFKVLALTRGWEASLPGFRLQDLRRLL
jgi:SAM-dependent MidA family methyltransferase